MYKSQKIYFEGTGGLKETINKDTAITVKRVKKRVKKKKKKPVKRPQKEVVDKLKKYKGKDNILLEILRLVLKQGEAKPKQTKAEPLFKPPKKGKKMKAVLPTRGQVNKQRELEKKARAAEFIKVAAEKKRLGQPNAVELNEADKLIEDLKNTKRQQDKEYFESFKGIDVDFFMKQAEYSRILVDEEVKKQEEEAARIRAGPPAPIDARLVAAAPGVLPQPAPPGPVFAAPQAGTNKLQKIEDSIYLSEDAKFWLMANTEVQRFSGKAIDIMVDEIEKIIAAAGEISVNKDELPQLLLFSDDTGGRGYRNPNLKPVGKSLFAEYQKLEPESSSGGSLGGSVDFPPAAPPPVKMKAGDYRKKEQLSVGVRKSFDKAFQELTGISIPANRQLQEQMGFSEEDLKTIRSFTQKYVGMGDTPDINKEALKKMEDLAYKYYPGEYNNKRLEQGLPQIQADEPPTPPASIPGTESFFSPSSVASTQATASTIPEAEKRKWGTNPIFESNNQELQRLRDERKVIEAQTGSIFSGLLGGQTKAEKLQAIDQQIAYIDEQQAKIPARIEQFEKEQRAAYKASKRKLPKGPREEREAERQKAAQLEELRLQGARAKQKPQYETDLEALLAEIPADAQTGGATGEQQLFQGGGGGTAITDLAKPKKLKKAKQPAPEPEPETFGQPKPAPAAAGGGAIVDFG
tara:strand:+ start:300 stop:2369 length:2070 start_codon:yes stop_codon:yes gene_type:complete